MATAYRTKMGTMIFPYKRSMSAIAQGTWSYDEVYHKRVEQSGFEVPYQDGIAFLTYHRDYDEIEKCLGDIEIKDLNYSKFIPFKKKIKMNKDIELRDSQNQIVHQMDFEKDNAWYINLPTGEGKTVLGAFLSCQFNLKTWVMCFSKDILNQWYDTYCKMTNVDPKKIKFVDGPFLRKVLDGKKDPNEYDIFLSTPIVLSYLGKNEGNYGLVTTIFEKCGIGTFIFDEAHRHLSNFIKISCLTNCRYQLCLSADYGQGNFKRERYFLQVFRKIPVLTPTEELQRSLKHTKVTVVEYNSYPSELEQFEPFSRYGYNPELFMNYEIKKGVITDCIHYLLELAGKTPQYRTLILFNNVAPVELFYELIKGWYPKRKVGRYHGGVPEDEKYETKTNADIIVATYSSFGTGLDTDAIKFVISTNQCNKVVDNQAAGRSRKLPDGSDGIYFMLVDVGYSYCRNKLKSRLRYLQDTKSKGECAYKIRFHPDIHQVKEE